MEEKPLVIISTRLPPQICGIGTYSWLLDQHWPYGHSRRQFLVVDGASRSKEALDHASLSEFNGQAAKLSRALERLGSANLLLHFAGRGYHRYGWPTWLPRVLRTWKARHPADRLLVFFHELPGDNYPIFSRYFWIDTLNRGVIRKLAGLADVIVTNTADHVTKIQKISGRTDVHFIPVGSNIEPVAHGSESRAETEFAILGLPFGRWQTLQTFDREIPRWHRNGQLTKLHLIGPIDEKFDSRSERLIAAWPERGFVIRHGLLAPAEISALLSKLQFSLTNVTLENWSKSSAFMAYAVHNCAIVSRAKCDLVPLCFTIAPSELTKAGNVDLMARANALQKWYQENADWNITAKKVAALLHGHLPQEALS